VYGERGLVVWGICADVGTGDTLESAEAYRDYFGLTYPVLFDEDGVVYSDYNQQAAFDGTVFPQDWVIGADGTVLYARNSYEYSELVAVIEQALEDAGL
jgi:peroxiredoxin